jgi:signal peptidase complex subunit 3
VYINEEASDGALIHYDINADFRKVFNWNVKQIYIYLTAEYITKKNVN